MQPGDIILVPFPFTDLSGSKVRPAIVLAVTALDATLAFVTTQLQWQESTDVFLNPSPLNGLKKTSLVRLSKLATIDKGLANGKLGELNTLELLAVKGNLIVLFQL